MPALIGEFCVTGLTLYHVNRCTALLFIFLADTNVPFARFPLYFLTVYFTGLHMLTNTEELSKKQLFTVRQSKSMNQLVSLVLCPEYLSLVLCHCL